MGTVRGQIRRHTTQSSWSTSSPAQAMDPLRVRAQDRELALGLALVQEQEQEQE
jgi:hypothetical protein